jgi:hypothetical protein
VLHETSREAALQFFFNQTAAPENGCAANKSHPALKRVLVAGTLPAKQGCSIAQRR